MVPYSSWLYLFGFFQNDRAKHREEKEKKRDEERKERHKLREEEEKKKEKDREDRRKKRDEEDGSRAKKPRYLSLFFILIIISYSL